MLERFPHFERGQIDEFYETLSTKNKTIVKDYLEYRRARGVNSENKIKDIRRFIIQFKFVIEKGIKDFTLKDLRGFLALLNNSYLSINVKNNMKTDLKNFLRFLFPDWSMRFNSLDDIKCNSHTKNEQKINASAMISKKDINKLISHEPKNYWKAFLLVQYEAGLRTGEVRLLKWEDIKNEGEMSRLTIHATKTGRTRVSFVKEATHYLERLKEEQENTGIKSVYVFHGRQKTNQPVQKSTVNMWFSRLTEKTLGEKKWNYLLRHTRATELYKLAKENKIAKDTAIKFMGHSEDMSATYTNLDKEDVEKMLKDQVYNIEEMPEERKHELEIELDGQKKQTTDLQKKVLELTEKIDGLLDGGYEKEMEKIYEQFEKKRKEKAK